MNAILIMLGCLTILTAEPQEEPSNLNIWNRLTTTSQEVGILQRDIQTLREKIKEHDGIIYMINRNILGLQNNIGSQVNQCPYQKNRNYIDIVLGIFALFGVVGIWNTIAGVFKKKPIAISPDFLTKTEPKKE